MYTVIGSLASRAFRVLWMLEELGLPYEHAPVRPHDPLVLKHSASGKIPVLLDGDQAIYDSVAIITYLADKHGRLTAEPGTLDRARQDAMTLRIIDEFDALLWTAGKHSFVLPEDRRIPEVKPTLRWEFARAEAALIRDIGDQPFLMGDEITIPDIVLTHCLGWAIVAKFGIAEPGLSAYLDRLRNRLPYIEAREKAAQRST